jgi:hypothetical protein
MYENEEVDDNEAKNLAKELNAIFVKASAKSSTTFLLKDFINRFIYLPILS